MRKGFTLVEMSIVLVIIGIVIGFVTKGRSLIETAQLTKEMSKIRNVKNGIELYRGSGGKNKLVMNAGYTADMFNLYMDESWLQPESLVTTIRKDYVPRYGLYNCHFINGRIFLDMTAYFQKHLKICLFITHTEPENTVYRNSGGLRISERFLCTIEKTLDNEDYETGYGQVWIYPGSFPAKSYFETCTSKGMLPNSDYRLMLE